MSLQAAGFDWDQGNRAKCQKHGISIAEIEVLFASRPRVASDLKHSAVEDRFVAVGRNAQGRPMFVVFTLRQVESSTLIRPLSARYMHRREIESYEEEGSEADER